MRILLAAVTGAVFALAQPVAADQINLAPAHLRMCLRIAASDGDIDPDNVPALATLVQRCPTSALEYLRACTETGMPDGDCRLNTMLMALDAASRAKR